MMKKTIAPHGTGQETRRFRCKIDGEAAEVIRYDGAASLREDAAALRTVESPYLTRLYSSELLQGFPVETVFGLDGTPCDGRKFSESQLKNLVIPAVNQGLHALHQAGLLHQALTPSAVLFDEPTGQVRLRVSAVEHPLPEAYQAPELLFNHLTPAMDYYAFGVLLAELFTGREPAVWKGRAVIPDSLPKGLKELVSALTVPEKRWGYREVCLWLDGSPVPVPPQESASAGIQPFYLHGRPCSGAGELAQGLGEGWESGKKLLFSGKLRRYLALCNPKAAGLCDALEQREKREPESADDLYWYFLYHLSPGTTAFYWKDHWFPDLKELGASLLERLRAGNPEQLPYYEELLTRRKLSEFGEITCQEEGLQRHLRQIEEMAEKRPAPALWSLAFRLSGEREITLLGQSVRTVEEMAEVFQKCLTEAPDEFEAVCGGYARSDGALEPELEGWLLTQGKAEAVTKWRQFLLYGKPEEKQI